MTGVFFAFSTAVMSGLARLENAQGLSAMQSMNRTILNPLFLLLFMGTAVSCVIVFIMALGRWSSPSGLFFLAGCAFYLIGSLLVTMIINVPLNNSLIPLEPSSSEGTTQWLRYLGVWTSWNHIRGLASLTATVSLMIALYLEARG
jgi:uncharacterized membrane protein